MSFDSLSTEFAKFSIEQIELMTADSNLILMDDENIYYEIPEACAL